LDFRRVLEVLRREELKAACEALGLDAGGREKSQLVDRILGGEEEPTKEPSSSSGANEPLTSSSPPPPASVRGEGALKSALRRFVLDLAGGLRGRDAATSFVSRLLQCFGWPEAGPPEATMPAPLSIVENGQRSTRDVPLFWKDRRVLVEVVKHDVMLDF